MLYDRFYDLWVSKNLFIKKAPVSGLFFYLTTKLKRADDAADVAVAVLP